MDADFSHDPAALPALVAPDRRRDRADLVIGSPLHGAAAASSTGASAAGVISRGGSLFARTVLGLRPHDLTGGFKAWRASTLAAIPFDGVHAGGYVFQIEMTFRASRAGARIREVPITFRDRRVGQSKMCRRIIVEALVVVVQLRAEELARPAARVARGRRVTGSAAGATAWPGRWGAAATGAARASRRPRRPAAAGARPSAGHGRLSRGTAGRLRRGSARGRIVRVPAPVRSRRPDRRARPTSTSSAGGCCHRPACCARGALTIDPFLLRGASLGAAWRADRGGAAGAVYHAVGGGPLPIASRLPIVVTLLDLAPWEFPARSSGRSAARFGQRLRAPADPRRGGGDRRHRGGGHRGAPRCSTSGVTGSGSCRWRRAPGRSRRRRTPDATAGRSPTAARERERLGLPERYLVYSGRFDARHDVATLLRALRPGRGRPPGRLAATDVRGRRASSSSARRPTIGPPLARAAAASGVGEPLAYAPALGRERLAGLVRGARAAILPVLSDAAGPAALEAIASGTPVVASAVGALPEVVGAAGLLVEPRDPSAWRARFDARSGRTTRVHAGVAAAARGRRRPAARTWARRGRRDARGLRRGRGPPPLQDAGRRAAPARLGAGVGSRRDGGRPVGGARRRDAAVLDRRTVRASAVDLDERLADGERHRLAVGRRRTGRRGQRRLPPRALDGLAVRRDPGLARADDVRLEAVLCG